MLKECYITVLILWVVLAIIVSQNNVESLSITASKAPSNIPISLPNCPDKCGEITVPYPFGIGDDCHYNPPLEGFYYNFTCDKSNNPPTLVFPGPNIEVTNITLDGAFWANHYTSFSCYDKANREEHFILTINNLGSRVTISPTQNSLVAIGCDTYAWFGGTGISNGTVFNSGCMSVCNREQKGLLTNKCSGIGCCLGFITDGVNNISIEARSFNKHLNVSDFNPCSVAFLVANGAMPSSLGDLLAQDATYFRKLKFPVAHHWSIGAKDCKTAMSSGQYLCKGNAACLDLTYQKGYLCQCKPGFQGNPYLNDCLDIDECAQGIHDCERSGYCVNSIGSYECLCPQGYLGKGTKNDPCVLDLNSAQHRRYKILVGTSVTFGLILSILGGWWLYSMAKASQIVKQRAKYFARNGSLLLKEEVNADEVIDRIKIFTIDELEKATDNFSEDRILGLGGRGTVYKGMLAEGKIVAVKKSNDLEQEHQLGEFINEVAILSHINHRNIVKLLGCCLETKVPLLVYEFIPNGTLYSHLHNPCEDFPITWKMRLQIASDSAGALAYLHSSSSIPIFHRDIKSSNILLDDRYRAKLSDFGTSRSVSIDQTHVNTRVMGTFGYMDPEYFRSSKFTEKSDVYSFGVVLVELLTGQKAIRATLEDLEQERSLITWFISHMERCTLFDIVDSQILQEGLREEFVTIANLAKRCLNLDGKKRPTMKKVLIEIESVLSLHLPQISEAKDAEVEHFFPAKLKNMHIDWMSRSSTFGLETMSLSSDVDSMLFHTS